MSQETKILTALNISFSRIRLGRLLKNKPKTKAMINAISDLSPFEGFTAYSEYTDLYDLIKDLYRMRLMFSCEVNTNFIKDFIYEDLDITPDFLLNKTPHLVKDELTLRQLDIVTGLDSDRARRMFIQVCWDKGWKDIMCKDRNCYTQNNYFAEALLQCISPVFRNNNDKNIFYDELGMSDSLQKALLSLEKLYTA